MQPPDIRGVQNWSSFFPVLVHFRVDSVVEPGKKFESRDEPAPLLVLLHPTSTLFSEL